MITTKISIKQHLVEYVTGKFGQTGGCIRFPDQLDLYHTIWNLTERRPERCPPDAGNIEIILPDRREGKAPETYNFLSYKSQRIIERRIENLFWAELHDFVLEERHRYGIPYIDAIQQFICRYSIDSITEDGLKKNCYRWINRMRIRKKRGYERKEILPT